MKRSLVLAFLLIGSPSIARAQAYRQTLPDGRVAACEILPPPTEVRSGGLIVGGVASVLAGLGQIGGGAGLFFKSQSVGCSDAGCGTPDDGLAVLSGVIAVGGLGGVVAGVWMIVRGAQPIAAKRRSQVSRSARVALQPTGGGLAFRF